MSVWDTYEALAGVRGVTRRDTRLRREKRYLTTRLPDNLSYFSVTIDGANQEVAIINSDNLDEKYIYSMPGENFNQGGMVYWMDCYWLIEEKDANNEIYTRGKLLQCNYLLKWVDESGIIREQWCHVEDGTKYLTGEFEDWLYKALSACAEMRMNKYLLNCWNTLRALLPKQNSEQLYMAMV